MSRPLDPNDEELLARVLTGDVRTDDPRVAALPPAAKEQLANLTRLQQVLEVAATTERTVLTDLAESPSTPPPSANHEPPLRDPAARAFWLRGAGLAALAAGFLLLVQSFDRDGAGGSGGGGASGTFGQVLPVELLEPHGAVDGEYALFRWQPREAAPLDRYVLSIWDAAAFDADSGATPLLTRELAATSWRPEAAALPLPDRITWRVDVQPLEGVLRRGPVATAWRRR
jgi:hypothetical protein